MDSEKLSQFTLGRAGYEMILILSCLSKAPTAIGLRSTNILASYPDLEVAQKRTPSIISTIVSQSPTSRKVLITHESLRLITASPKSFRYQLRS
jgi:hypothetical protein